MAVIIKDNNNTALNLAGSWVGGATPGTANTGKFDGTLTAFSALSITGRTFFGSFWYSNSCPVTAIDITGTSNLEFYNNTGSTPNGRSILIEANRTVTSGSSTNIIFLNASNHLVEIGQNSEFRPDGRILGTTSGAGTSSVTKLGLGSMWFNRNSTAPGIGAITGLTISEGTAIIGGTTAASPLGSGNITFSDTGSGSPSILFQAVSTSSCTLANPISMVTAGTITVPSGFSATITGAVSGAGTLTVAGAGSVTVNNTISSPLNVTGTLLLGAGYSLTGSTLTGNGAVTLTATGSLYNTSSTFTGSLAGNFSYYTSGSMSCPGNFTGYFSIPDASGASTLTLSGISSGGIDTIYSSSGNKKTVVVTGSLNGISPPNVNLRLGTEATITLSGASASVAAPISLGFGATLSIANGATTTSAISTVAGGGYNDHYINADSSSSNVMNSNITTSDAVGSLDITVATGGTLTLNGASQSITGNAGRTITKKGAGIMKVTGGFSVTGSPFSMSAGTLHLNTTSQTSFGAGLSMANGTALACSATGSVTPRIAGNITFAAGSSLKFGAP